MVVFPGACGLGVLLAAMAIVSVRSLFNTKGGNSDQFAFVTLQD